MKKTCGQSLAEKMREKFPEAETIKFEMNEKITKATMAFIRKVEKAHKNAGKSKLRFGCT